LDATPRKLKMPVSLMGRVRTGEKGIGRLSTARLGSALEMATKREGGSPLVVRLDWAQLARVEKLSQFVVTVAEDPRRVRELDVETQGTCIRISDLHRICRVVEEGGADLD